MNYSSAPRNPLTLERTSPKLSLKGTDLLSFMHKDAIAQLVELLREHVTGAELLQILMYAEITACSKAIEFRYNNQLFAVYCSHDLAVAVSKCQCGVVNLLHDYSYARSEFWELYLRGHLVAWQFSPSNPKVIQESKHEH